MTPKHIFSRWSKLSISLMLAFLTLTLAVNAQNLTLRIENDHFTVGGQPKFLTFISYFDAMDASTSTLNSDFYYLKQSGFDGVRIFPNWWGKVYPTDPPPPRRAEPSDRTLVDGRGSIRPERLNKVREVINLAQQHGLLVDVSFAYETVEGLSVAAFTTGVAQVARDLVGYTHILFDVQNESNKNIRDDSQVNLIVNEVRRADPTRIVFASRSSDITPQAAVSRNFDWEVIAYHESRDPDWFSPAKTNAVVSALRASNRPVYLQEPEKWLPFGWQSGLTAQNFIEAVTNARLAGAAAWCFHTFAGFELNDTKTIQNQLSSPEKGFVASFKQSLDNACTYSLTPSGQTFGFAGGTGSVRITTQLGCAWSASSPQPFINITSGGSGSISGNIIFNVLPNPTTSQRIGYINTPRATFTIAQEGIPNSAPGYGAVADFSGDRRADIADYHIGSGQFWIRLNNGNGTFWSPGTSWGYGVTALSNSGWQALVGDFTGDGYADYADLHLASGNFWVHENLRNGSFSGANWSSGVVAIGPNVEIITGDVNGDRLADVIAHNRLTGTLEFWRNDGSGTNRFVHVGAATLRTQTGASWRTLIADFTGDGYADVADYHVPSAQFWIHQNIGNYQFNPNNWGYGAGFNHPVFTVVVGDFTGDGYADYADVNRNSGDFWVHENLRNGSFASASNWGYGRFTASTGFSIFGLPVTFPAQ